MELWYESHCADIVTKLILILSVAAASRRRLFSANVSPESNIRSNQPVRLRKFHRNIYLLIQCRRRCLHELDPTNAGYYSLYRYRIDNTTLLSYNRIPG